MAQASAEQLAAIVEKSRARQASLTQEQKDANKAKMQELMADPAKVQEMMSMGSDAFLAADADGDGKLNFAEYKVFAATIKEKQLAHGIHHPETSDAELEDWWTTLCTIAGTPDGISQADHQSITGQIKQTMKADQWVAKTLISCKKHYTD